MQLTDQNFDSEVLKSDVPVLVDFFAPWCGPCQMMGPIIDELTEELKDKKLKLAKLNVDESPKTAGKYNVMSIPTIIIFKAGEPTETLTGVQNKEELKKKLEELVNN
ncbi:thioredoxin [Candidatus Falkowbacteria bacterium]|nr:thioredoxin [Candidatus Falkowbacteria bacterium]